MRKRDKVPDNREVEIINKWKELDTVHVMMMMVMMMMVVITVLIYLLFVTKLTN